MEWDWNDEKKRRWLEPAIEAPYLARRWKGLGFRAMLDNGCGPGRHAVYFSGEGFLVTALDQSQEALRYLTGWAAAERRNVQTVRGDIFHMPFPDESFDCAMDYNVSYHTDTAGFHRAVAELHRVLKPGGECYMTLLSQNDTGFAAAPPSRHLDAFTLAHEGGTPHFYGKREALGEIFAGFSLAIPLREITTRGAEGGEERTHFHLLLRKDTV